MEIPSTGSSAPKNTVYDQRYQSKENYWEFKPSLMCLKILELSPPLKKTLKVLDIGCGEGGNAIFLGQNGYNVTAFDLAPTAVEKTKKNAEKYGLALQVFTADVNEFEPDENYDIIFSSGTVQYLLPENRPKKFLKYQQYTNVGGLHVIQTFVKKPFVATAPDAEENEHLWESGELLMMYRDWKIENFIEEIKPCNSSNVPHEHAHNRIWAKKIV